MADSVKVVAPSSDTQLALSRAGISNHTLVFDGKSKKWKLIKKADLDKYKQPYYVTLTDFQNGKTEVMVETVKSSKPSGGGVSGSVSDRTLVENAIGSSTITIGPSGPQVNYGFPNAKTGEPETFQAYLYVDDKGGVSAGPDEARAGVTRGKEFTFDRTDAARDKHLKDLYKIFGNKQAIIDRLYNAGYLKTNKDVPTDAMLAALDAAAAQYTVDQVEGYKSKQITEFETLAQWLGQRQDQAPESLAGTRTSTRVVEFSDLDARAVIDDVVSALMQRKPSKKEYEKLVPLLQRKQRKTPEVTSTTTDEKGRVVATKTKTGFNEQQFLLEKLSERDEAKANVLMSYYDAFKQAIGVR